MAGLALLDFTSGNVNLNVVVPGGGTSGTNLGCALSDLAFRMSRTLQDRKTLCSGPWQQGSPQNKGATITGTLQASQGVAYSDPLIFMSVDDPVAITFTADTGCTITGLFHCTDEGLGGVAGSSLFAGPLVWASYGSLSSIWVDS